MQRFKAGTMNGKSVKWVSLSDSQIFKCTFAASMLCRAGNAEKKRQKDGRRGIGCASVCLLQWWAPPPLPSSSSRLLLSSSPHFPSLPFASSLPFSNPLPRPVVFQLFSQNQSNGTSCSTDPGLSPGPSSRAPGFSTRCVAGFVTGHNLHPVDCRFFPPVILLTWWMAGFVAGHTSHQVGGRFCHRW